MREILFKAKRLNDGEWVEGNIVYVAEDADFMPGAYILPRLVSASAAPPTKGIMLGDFFEVDPSTVCEWTGIIDRDGTKVFEGDRLFDPHEKRTFVVEYDPLEAGFTLESNDGRYIDFNRVPYSKIIGSIHDGEGNND